MEESEKRKERLKAMRMEASQAGPKIEIGSEFHQLSNPLIESSVTSSMQTNSPGTPRFDYYTDPMAAFSKDKRMSKDSYQNSPGSSNRVSTPRNPEMTPSPAHLVWPTYSPDPRMNQPPSPYYFSGAMRLETTSSPAYHFRPTSSPDPRMYRPQSSYYSSGPMNHDKTQSQAHHVQPPYSPNPRMYQQPRGSYYNSGPRNPSISPSPFAPEGHSGYFQARGPYQSSYANMRSPSFIGTPTAGSGYGSSPNSGRGRGCSGFGRSGNRGFGSHGSISGYYNKSMVEDPWKDLEPSLWKNEVISVKVGFSTPDSTKFSHSDSFKMKRARISEGSEPSSSQPSLAEYLAAAFNETVGEKGDIE